MKKSILTALLVVSSVVGAGFASGQEVLAFFGSFNIYSAICVLVAFLLFGLFIYILLRISHTQNEYGKLDRAFKLFRIVFCIVLCSSMVAGLFEIEKEFIKNSYSIFSLLILIFCFIIAGKSVDFLKTISFFLVPVVLAFIVILFAKTAAIGNLSVYTPVEVVWGLPKSFLYVAFNLFTITGVLHAAGRSLNKKEAKAASLIASSILCSCMLFIMLAFRLFGIHAASTMPLAEIAASFGIVFKVFYFIVLFISIVTSLISFVFSLLVEVKQTNDGAKILLFTIIFNLSFIGFQNLVNKVYMVQSVVTCLYFLLMLWLFIKNKFKTKKNLCEFELL